MYIKNIEESQKQYFELIKKYERQIFSNKINKKQIAMIIDEVQGFWLNKKDILAFELEKLTSQRECFMLSGAVYLGIKDNEHYIFKALGDEHIISDPLLKLENFFRVPSQIFDENSSIEIFRKAYADILLVLSKYQNDFYILPINLIAIENQDEHMKLLQKFFLNFINTMLNEDFDNLNDFFKKYSTYDDIEKNMASFFKENLTFNEYYDKDLSLKEKIETYINTQSILVSLLRDKSEAEKFILALHNYVTQIIDILSISLITNITPAIRFKPTFYYLTIVMHTFSNDEYFKNMIEKTIIYYIFYNTIKKENLVKIDFDKYKQIIKEINYLYVIKQKMKEQNINIFEKGVNVNDISMIIEQTFCKEINRYNKT